jgi:flagellar biosynthesis protein
MEKIPKAVALRYDKDKDAAPRVIAKGRGDIAKKIIEIADARNLPRYEDKNLIQILEALELETEIPPELYRAVAEVLAFVYRLNGRTRIED